MDILIIDDSEDDRQLIRREVAREIPEANLTEIGSRPEFDAALSGGVPRLAIVDFALGWGQGIQLSQELKAAFPECAVIMFTGTLGEDSAVEAMKAGVDDYIVKSVGRLPRLRASIHSILRQTEERNARRAAEADRDVLLREVLHRVHNNLQIVLGLLRMHSRRAMDPGTRNTLDDIARRIQALAQIQGRLYKDGNYLALNFGRYLHDLTEALEALGAQGRNVALERYLSAVEVPIEKAGPLGMIANELLTNAYQHAFVGRQEGKICVELTSDSEGDSQITVSDNGIGMENPQSGGIGNQLIHMLAKQVGARVEIHSQQGGGTTVTVRFNNRVAVRAA